MELSSSSSSSFKTQESLFEWWCPQLDIYYMNCYFAHSTISILPLVLEKNFNGTVPMMWIWDRPIKTRHIYIGRICGTLVASSDWTVPYPRQWDRPIYWSFSPCLGGWNLPREVPPPMFKPWYVYNCLTFDLKILKYREPSPEYRLSGRNHLSSCESCNL